MNEQAGERTTSPMSRPLSPLPASHPPSIQPDHHQEEEPVTSQPVSGTGHSNPLFPVLLQPVAQPLPDKEDEAPGCLAWGYGKHDGTSRSSRQATVESAESSPVLPPAQPMEIQPAMAVDGVVSPLTGPFRTLVGSPPASPWAVDSVSRVTTAESLENTHPPAAEEPRSCDIRTVPVLQVATPPGIYQQEQQGGPINSLARWWWLNGSSSFCRPS